MTLTSPTNKLQLEVKDHCAVLTLNNPSANIWDEDSLQGMVKIIDQLNAEPAIYSMILTGQGEKFFCAGADLKMFRDGNKEKARQVAKQFGECMDAIQRFKGVSIAAINGFAMGGGLEAALACDLRIAESHAQMALPEAAVGLLPCGHGTQTLPWTVGVAWAKRMILTGERVNAETALRISLIEEIVPQGQSKLRALEIAKNLEKQSPTSTRFCKELIDSFKSVAPRHALPLERERFVDLFDTQDQKEGVNAFLEKRPASWKNA